METQLEEEHRRFLQSIRAGDRFWNIVGVLMVLYIVGLVVYDIVH